MNLQTACLTKLTVWHKYRKYALYRRTEDFIQWLLFDTSEFGVAARPHYSIQALATQFPAEALTLGDCIRDKRGVELWLRSDDWQPRKDEIVEQIVRQIDPPAFEPFTIEVVVDFLNRFKSEHIAAITARGIAALIAGDMGKGYAHLKQALKKNKDDPRSWARVEEARLNGWLSCSPDDIVSVLRQQAEIGAQLLRLK
jgi:hypothetical protein